MLKIKFTCFFDHCISSIRKPPIRLPGKALNIIKDIALGLGVVEIVLDDKHEKGEEGASPSERVLPHQEKEVRDEME